MTKITAWKCPHTGILFEDHVEYKQHLAELSRIRVRQRNYQGWRDNIYDVINGEKTCLNIQELCEYILKHSKEYMIMGLMANLDDHVIKKALENGHKVHFPKFTGMRIFNARWDSCASNSHSAPRGKVTNFCQEGDEPRGYPGWTARVRIWHKPDAKIIIVNNKTKKVIRLEVPSLSDCTDRHSGINTGSGGGSADGSYYGITIYAEDFPEMERNILFNCLKETIGAGSKLDAMAEGLIGQTGD